MNNYQNKVKHIGLWSFYVTKDGKPLSNEELATLRSGGDIGRAVEVHHYKNIVTIAGRKKLNDALSGAISAASEIKINYQELGTGTTAPAAGDTGLQTPSAGTRKVISSSSVSNETLNLTSFWAAGEATGTWKEYGTFINGTATSNSGTLYNHVAINVTVGATDAVTVDGTVIQSI